MIRIRPIIITTIFLSLLITSFSTAEALIQQATHAYDGEPDIQVTHHESLQKINSSHALRETKRPSSSERTRTTGVRTSDFGRVTLASRGASGRFYSVAYQTKLTPTSYPGVSRARHFQEANENLLRAMESDPAFARMIQQSGINLQRTATGLAPRTPPSGWTWHHAPERGVMELVPRSQHAPGSIFQETIHPGGSGGYSIWGK